MKRADPAVRDKVRASIDALDQPAWVAMVRWIAPQLVYDDPELLVAILCERAGRPRERDDLSEAERLAGYFKDCGLMLAVKED